MISVKAGHVKILGGRKYEQDKKKYASTKFFFFLKLSQNCTQHVLLVLNVTCMPLMFITSPKPNLPFKLTGH